MVITHTEDDLCARITRDGGGKVWIAGHSLRDVDADIYVSSNHGSRWSAALQLTSDPGDEVLPSFSQNNSDRIWVSWMSKRCSDWDTFASYYDGLTWSSPKQITDHAASLSEVAHLQASSRENLMIKSWILSINSLYRLIASALIFHYIALSYLINFK